MSVCSRVWMLLVLTAILVGCKSANETLLDAAPADAGDKTSTTVNAPAAAADSGNEPALASMVTRPISFTASDGAVLQAFLTSSGGDEAPRPLIVEFSPYGPTSFKASTGTHFGPRYNYLEVQGRGTGNSTGSWGALGPRDQKDVAEVLAWACQQPFSNGHIGLYGFSASAIAIYNSMHLPLACVDAAALMAGTVDLYRDLLYPGGILNLGPAVVVGFGVGTPLLLNGLQNLAQGELPLDTVLSGLGQLGLYANILTHSTEDAYWRQRTLRDGPNRFPVLMDTSFYDPEPRGIFLAFKRLRKFGAHLIVFGAHDGFPKGTPGPFPQYQRWFDHYLLGVDNGIEQDPRVQLLVGHGSRAELTQGKLTKINGDDWPLPGTQWRSLYLSATRSGSANSSNDGSFKASAEAAQSQAPYLVLPSIPTMADPHNAAVLVPGGDMASMLDNFFLGQINSVDALALTWTTPPLQQDVDVVGPASLELYLSTLLPSVDIYAVVADVWPDGSAHAVGVGRLRTDFPNIDPARSLKDAAGNIVQPYGIYSQRSPAPLGKLRKYYVEFWPLGNRFQQGHRLRLYLLGTTALGLSATPVNLSTAWQGGATPSRLLVPVLDDAKLLAPSP